jgi:hypothetical protein
MVSVPSSFFEGLLLQAGRIATRARIAKGIKGQFFIMWSDFDT